MVVHQLIPTFTEGDAMGTAALHFQLLLRRMGIYGEVYAGEVAPELTSLVRPLSALRPERDELVLYHHGIASPLSGRLMHLPCRRGLVFHNISPAHAYAGTPLEEPLRGGRAQLAAMAPHLELAIGVSAYNARELREAGHQNVQVVPLFVEPERFRPERADPALRRRLANDGLTVLSVSRVIPHKRVEDLLSLHAELLRLDPRARLVIVGGGDAGSAYVKALRARAARLSGVEFLGKVSHAELVAAYRSAHVYVSMSEHEGFGVPLLEAMAAEVPVLAYAAAAVPETLGGAGIAFDQKRFALLAELVAEVGRPGAVRSRLLAGQARRLEALSAAHAQARLEEALGSIGVAPVAFPRKPRRPRKPKVAFVVQRYGDISGGAELQARAIAERLTADCEVTALTTCAKDHLTWANELPAGESRAGGVRILRFPTERPRDIRRFNAYCRKLYGRPIDRVREEHFIAEQGPLSRGLLRHLAEQRDAYDAFICFTYLYTTAAWGMPLVADRAIMVTTAHDEPPIAFHAYRDVFERPRGIICQTPEEEALIHRLFPAHAPTRIASIGVEGRKANPARFRKKHGLERPYLFYVGRVEGGKGIPELLAHHQALVKSFHDAPELVLAGTASMTIRGERVRYLGRVSEEDKYDALSGALGVVVPSKYESLSLLLLEAYAQGTPVLVNGASEVLAGQIARSRGGFVYTDRQSFLDGVKQLGAERSALAKKALAYARKYTWEAVLSAYREEIDRVMR